MADKIRKVSYFTMIVQDKPGQGVNILGALKDAGVNLLAFTGFPRGRKAHLYFIPEDTAAFNRAAKKAGLKIDEKKTGFLVQGNDRVGAVANILTPLAEAGINVTAMDAIATGKGRYGAIVWLKQEDVRKAAKVLGAS